MLKNDLWITNLCKI